MVTDSLDMVVGSSPGIIASISKNHLWNVSFRSDRIHQSDSLSEQHRLRRKADLAVTDREHVRPVPEGYSTVTPWIISRNTAGLIAFLEKAFDATELARVEMEDGTIGHAEVRI